MNHVFPRWNALYLAACLLALWPVGLEAATAYRTLHLNTDAQCAVTIRAHYVVTSGGCSGSSQQHDIYVPANETTGIGPYGISCGSSTPMQGNYTFSRWLPESSTWEVILTGSFTSVNPTITVNRDWEAYANRDCITCKRTVTLSNDQLTMVRGFWVLDGSVIYTADIPPGESRTHTLTPEDCDNYSVEAHTVVLELSPDFELVPSTNVVFQTDATGPDTTNTASIVYGPPLAIDAAGALTGATAPVQWSAASGTNVNQALQEGFTAGLISQQQFDAQTLALLNAIRTNTQYSAEEVAKLHATITNVHAADILDRIALTDDAGIQAWTLASQDAALAEAMAKGEELVEMADKVFESAVYAPDATTDDIEISKGNFNYTFNGSILGWGPMAGILGGMRAAFGWLIVLWLFTRSFTLVWQAAINIMQVPQGTTAGTSLAGTNVNASSAVIAAAVICGVIVVAPTVMMVLLDTGFDGVNPFALAGAESAILAKAVGMADLMFPLGAALTAIASYFTFRYFALSTTIIQGMIIRLIVGL